MARLPTSPDQIDLPWINEALAGLGGDVKVADVRVAQAMGGTASKLFLEVDYLAPVAGGPPRRLCLKGGFDDAMRALAGYGYQVEALFYRDIAPVLGAAVPRCWYADSDAQGNQGLVLIDDLAAAGATFGDPGTTYSLEQVQAGLSALAALHGSTWGSTGVGAAPWLTVGSQLFRPVADSFLQADHWARMLELEQTRSFDGALRDRERVARALHRLWELDDVDVVSVSHGDPHPRNTYHLDDGALRFLDWQTVCLAPWSDDVAYFLVGVLEVDARRAHEVELLRYYLDALREHGGPSISFDDAWSAYRRHHLHGLMFALCGPEMQPAEVCAVMGDRYGAAALDHGSVEEVERCR